MKVVIKEVTGINAHREGKTYEVESLTQAKRIASRNQAFYGTYLRIEDVNGNYLAIKTPNGKWKNFS